MTGRGRWGCPRGERVVYRLPHTSRARTYRKTIVINNIGLVKRKRPNLKLKATSGEERHLTNRNPVVLVTLETAMSAQVFWGRAGLLFSKP